MEVPLCFSHLEGLNFNHLAHWIHLYLPILFTEIFIFFLSLDLCFHYYHITSCCFTFYLCLNCKTMDIIHPWNFPWSMTYFSSFLKTTFGLVEVIIAFQPVLIVWASFITIAFVAAYGFSSGALILTETSCRQILQNWTRSSCFLQIM